MLYSSESLFACLHELYHSFEEPYVEGEVDEMTIPGGLLAVAHVEINEDQHVEAWAKFMGEWFPENGYRPGDRMCYEP